MESNVLEKCTNKSVCPLNPTILPNRKSVSIWQTILYSLCPSTLGNLLNNNVIRNYDFLKIQCNFLNNSFSKMILWKLNIFFLIAFSSTSIFWKKIVIHCKLKYFTNRVCMKDSSGFTLSKIWHKWYGALLIWFKDSSITTSLIELNPR